MHSHVFAKICNNCKSKLHQHVILRLFHKREQVRVRFAPSPTGFLHIGGLRTALYNYLFAKSYKDGKFVIRIEDTDQTRVVPGAVDHLMETLKWIGIKPDESPAHGGHYGPYLQSSRLHYYSKHADDLVQNGSAYRCFCTAQRLSLLKRDQQLRRENTRYDNRCRHLSSDVIEENLAQGKPYVVRLKVENGWSDAHDQLFGCIRHDVGSEGDPILLKSDGYPTYHLANVVDDHLMEISHVIRGKEWLVSTPKHLLIYKALGWQPPTFMHLPLLMNSDGTKLSKRQADSSVDYYKEQGYSPTSLINFMLYCGSGFPGVKFPFVAKNENVLLRNLSAAFDPGTLLQSDGVVERHKLDEFSKILTCHLAEHHDLRIRHQLVHDLFDLVLKHFGNDCIFCDNKFSTPEVWKYLISIINMRKNHIVNLSELISSQYDYLWLRPKIPDYSDTQYHEVLSEIVCYLQHLNWSCVDQGEASRYLTGIAKSRQLNYPKMMKFLRLCLTGKEEGPKVIEILLMLGKKESLRRLHIQGRLSLAPYHEETAT